MGGNLIERTLRVLEELSEGAEGIHWLGACRI